MKNIQTFSLALAMLICNLNFSITKDSNSINYTVLDYKIITGKIVINGIPTPGIKIKIAGKNIETTSNKGGKFRIKCNVDDEITCTYEGIQKVYKVASDTFIINFNFENKSYIKFKVLPKTTTPNKNDTLTLKKTKFTSRKPI